MKWQVTKQPCDKCGYIQISVHPQVCEYLECAICGFMNPAPYIEKLNFNHKTDENP